MLLYLPTTIGNRPIQVFDAVKRLTSHGYSIDVAHRFVHGMYVTSSKEIISEGILEIETSASPQVVCQLFDQESVLFQNEDGVYQLIDQHGTILVTFTHMHQQRCITHEEAFALQKEWALRFGGASRDRLHVWAFSV